MKKTYAFLPYLFLCLFFITFSTSCGEAENPNNANSESSRRDAAHTTSKNNWLLSTQGGANLTANPIDAEAEQSVEINLSLLNSLIENNSQALNQEGVKEPPSNATSVLMNIAGKEYSATILEISELGEDSRLILGNFQETGSEFTLIKRGNEVSGRFELPGNKVYRLSQKGENNFSLTGYFQDPAKACRTRTPDRPDRTRPSPRVPSPEGETSYVRVLVVYTPDVRLKHNNNVEEGSRAKIEKSIDELCAEARGVFIRSRTLVSLSCTQPREVNYTASGSMSNDLQALENPRDGSMDQIHTWRNEEKADLVILYVNDLNEGGLSNQMGVDELSHSFEAKAFGVVDWVSARTGLLFPHEIGHIFGAGHDRENTIQPGPGRLNYSAGYHYLHVSPGGGARVYRRTVMAYEIRDDEYLTSHFSNPEILYPETDIPVGTPLHNNAGTIRISAPTIAGFR